MPTLNLTNGELYWEEFGDPSGYPLFFFHGWPGSHLQAALASTVGAKLGLRLIAPDRPGIGGSQFIADRKISDWPKSVVELADSLGLSKFSIFAVSGGGPYALACAHHIPERLHQVGICSGVPYSEWLREDDEASALLRTAIKVHDKLPGLAPPIFSVLRSYMLNLSSVESMRGILPFLPEPDRSFLARTEMIEKLWLSTRESYRQSGEGVLHDIKLLTSEWGFQSWDVRFPIRWWQGDCDEICPLSAIQFVAGKNPSIHLSTYSNEGHYSLPLGRTEELLSHFTAN